MEEQQQLESAFAELEAEGLELNGPRGRRITKELLAKRAQLAAAKAQAFLKAKRDAEPSLPALEAPDDATFAAALRPLWGAVAELALNAVTAQVRELEEAHDEVESESAAALDDAEARAGEAEARADQAEARTASAEDRMRDAEARALEAEKRAAAADALRAAAEERLTAAESRADEERETLRQLMSLLPDQRSGE